MNMKFSYLHLTVKSCKSSIQTLSNVGDSIKLIGEYTFKDLSAFVFVFFLWTWEHLSFNSTEQLRA